MSSKHLEARTPRSGARKLAYALLILLPVAGGAVYFRLASKATAFAANASGKPDAVRHATVSFGVLEQSIRLTGTIGAEKFRMVQAPQLLGMRGSGHSSSSASNTTTPSSAPTFTPSTGSSASTSIGTLRGNSNRFSDRQSTNAAAPTTPAASNSSGAASGNAGANQSLRGTGEGDFNLTILKLAAPGTRVKAGDTIAEFDRQVQLLRLDDYKDTEKQLTANIEKIRSDLQTTRKAHDQIIFAAKAALDKALLDLKTAEVRSAIEAEGLKLNVEEAKARHEQLLKEVTLLETSQAAQIRAAEIDRDQAKIERERAQRNVDLMVIRAPMDGIVVMQTIFRGGDMGPAQQGDQLFPGKSFMEVIDPRSMLLSATVNQVDAERIRIGMKARIRLDAYPGLEFPAHVAGINALARPSDRRPNFMGEVFVRLRIDSIDEHVIPDISGSADIVLESNLEATIAPLGAIFYSGTASYVYRQTTAGWERRDVTLGLRNNTQAVIRSGLSRGDVIALSQPPGEP